MPSLSVRRPPHQSRLPLLPPALLCLAISAALPAHAQALSGRVVGVAGSADCADGLFYDDGSYEDAFGSGGGHPQSDKIVQYFQPQTLPTQFSQVCVAFTRLEALPGNGSMDFSIVFYAADADPAGSDWNLPLPGTPLAVIPAHIDDIPVYPASQTYAIDTSQAPVLGDDVYVGLDWNPSPTGPSPKVMASFDTTTATDPRPIFTRSDVGSERWQAMTTGLYSNYLRAMAIRVVPQAAASLPPARPSATPEFSPPVVQHGTPSTLSVTLANRNAADAVLTGDFSVALPDGLSASKPTTTCADGQASVSAGAFRLAAGAVIPPAASCTVSVSVVPAAAGRYAVAIASGDLQTDQGANTALPAQASLIVSSGGGSGGSIDENFDGVAAPELPAGWTSPVLQGLSIWSSTGEDADTAPNAVHAADAPRLSDFSLTSPAFTPAAGSVLSFRHKFEFENNVQSPPTCYDGGVLEISTDGGSSFTDIVDAGGAFLQGAYNCALANPVLEGRMGWGGTTGAAPLGPPLEWVEVKVDLGAFAGQEVVLRWREGTDVANSWYSASGDWPGWWIDSVGVGIPAPEDAIFRNGFEEDLPAPAAPTLSKAFAVDHIPMNTPTELTITLANANATPATLTADLIDAFPSGLVSAANASTTCGGGGGIVQTGSSVGLQAGATIPAAASCSISVAVAGVTAGDLTNTIPAGGLVTDQGSNAAPATAVLSVVAPTAAASETSKSPADARVTAQGRLVTAPPAAR